ncbi:hypothetical protein [Pseudoduganella violacea]|uniref:SnoaL-like domain-containing protein n=1 Tax=Pseudoduganella violacea TaxID=1715466 RepID=A0A7W5BD92_9BURK|nr:hypothetical protein [Pseudoduganella violacea]MBB3121003.1 hypothetical protein [Pseudoduganella violacea]
MPILTIAFTLGMAADNILAKKPIPAEAHLIIQKVRAAAKRKDFSTLRKLMVPEFTWSFGGDGDADQAIDAWRRDPRVMKELFRITGHRCAFASNEENIQCPPNAGYDYRAGFEKTEHGWRMTYFVAGD